MKGQSMEEPNPTEMPKRTIKMVTLEEFKKAVEENKKKCKTCPCEADSTAQDNLPTYLL